MCFKSSRSIDFQLKNSYLENKIVFVELSKKFYLSAGFLPGFSKPFLYCSFFKGDFLRILLLSELVVSSDI